MKSLCAALNLTAVALGNLLSAMLIPLANKLATRFGGDGLLWVTSDLNEGRLDRYFLLLAALMLANTAIFVLISRSYKYKTHAGFSAGVAREVA